jgi:hypothetical protein
MKKSKNNAANQRVDEDTMRPEYDFSKATRGVTAARYAEGTNVVLLDPDVSEVFPDARAVNEASALLHALRNLVDRRVANAERNKEPPLHSHSDPTSWLTRFAANLPKCKWRQSVDARNSRSRHQTPFQY